MKLILATLVTITTLLHAADDPLRVKDAAAIKRELTKEVGPVLIPKGADPKSARIIKREAERKARQVSLPAIRFAFNKVTLADAESERQFAELGRALNDGELKDAKFTLEGHTCDIGQDVDNLDLSRRRAAELKRRLTTEHGISESRIKFEGKGESSPEVANDSEAHRAQNRRVVVIREPAS